MGYRLLCVHDASGEVYVEHGFDVDYTDDESYVALNWWRYDAIHARSEEFPRLRAWLRFFGKPYVLVTPAGLELSFRAELPFEPESPALLLRRHLDRLARRRAKAA